MSQTILDKVTSYAGLDPEKISWLQEHTPGSGMVISFKEVVALANYIASLESSILTLLDSFFPEGDPLLFFATCNAEQEEKDRLLELIDFMRKNIPRDRRSRGADHTSH